MGFRNYMALMVMVGCQFLYAGTTLLVRVVVLEGVSSRVIVVYRQCIAFLLIAPFAFFPRKENNSRLGWKSFCWIFLLAFFGVTANQNANFAALGFVSSSVAMALYNLAPAITLIISYAIGLEKVNLRSLRSIAKIVGTVVCVSGAAALALTKGPKLLNTEWVTTNSAINHESELAIHDHTWLIGCFLVFVSATCWSLSLIMQVNVTACYNDPLSLTAWMSLMAALQSGLLTLIIEPNPEAWKLSSPLQLICCFYAGMTSVVCFFGQMWCISRRGPLFSAMFQPLCTVIVTVLACIFMHEVLYTGSLIGGLVAIGGLYIVLWGKAKDNEDVNKDAISCTDQVSDNCIIDLEEPLILSENSTHI